MRQGCNQIPLEAVSRDGVLDGLQCELGWSQGQIDWSVWVGYTVSIRILLLTYKILYSGVEYGASSIKLMILIKSSY